MALGEMLYEPGGQLQHAYFPTTAIVSLHYVMESGASAETAGVGNEGVVGVSLFMGGDTTPSSAVVQTAGHAYRLGRRLLRQEFNRAGLMQSLLLRYTQALLTQMSQTAACNRHHSVEQQLCRWLLLALDRVPSRELVMTQELVAGSLGLRRESIALAAGKLQHVGFMALLGVFKGDDQGSEARQIGSSATRMFQARWARRRRVAAASKAGEGFGGCSRSLRTRSVSRLDRTLRSVRSTTSRAVGNTLRMIKLVRSSRS